MVTLAVGAQVQEPGVTLFVDRDERVRCDIAFGKEFWPQRHENLGHFRRRHARQDRIQLRARALVESDAVRFQRANRERAEHIVGFDRVLVGHDHKVLSGLFDSLHDAAELDIGLVIPGFVGHGGDELFDPVLQLHAAGTRIVAPEFIA